LKPPFNLRQPCAANYFQIGCPKEAARVAPAHGPPLWEAADLEHDPAAEPLLPPIPAFEFDQRLSW
jgi:hypothetical protein